MWVLLLQLRKKHFACTHTQVLGEQGQKPGPALTSYTAGALPAAWAGGTCAGAGPAFTGPSWCLGSKMIGQLVLGSTG